MNATDGVMDKRATDELLIFYNDDPDPSKAGQGLAFAPLVFQTLQSDQLNYWMMTPSEQMAMVYLLERLRPKVAIEIGTARGGSLQVLSRYCERVYSLDIDPEVPARLANRYSNVEFLTGPTDITLLPLIRRLQDEKAELSFALVDGDHTAEGVRKDIDNLLQFKPVVPLYIVMHDSFNPECRLGLKTAHWSESQYVHAVELDFVGGSANPSPTHEGELWGGLALGILRPEPRRGRFEVMGRAELTFQIVHENRLKRQQWPLHRKILRRIPPAYRLFYTPTER